MSTQDEWGRALEREKIALHACAASVYEIRFLHDHPSDLNRAKAKEKFEYHKNVLMPEQEKLSEDARRIGDEARAEIRAQGLRTLKILTGLALMGVLIYLLM